MQVDVCVVLIDDGVHTRETLVIAGDADVTVTFAVPEMFVDPCCVEVAVQVPVPAPEGVNTPAEVIVPPVAVHVTAEV